GKAHEDVEEESRHAGLYGARTIARPADFASGGHFLLRCGRLRTADESEAVYRGDTGSDLAKPTRPLGFRRAAPVQSRPARQPGEDHSPLPRTRARAALSIHWRHGPRIAGGVVCALKRRRNVPRDCSERTY